MGKRVGLLSANGRYLVNTSGAPVLMVGDAAWSMIAQLTNAQIDTYLADRAGRGFNFVLVSLLEHQFAANAPNNIDNVAPFTGALWTTPNNAYMTRADYAVAKAASLGIYVLLAPTYLGYAGLDEGWSDEIAAASNADLQSWGAYCGGRWGSAPNVVWVLGGDTDPAPYAARLAAFKTGLIGAGAGQLITAHTAPGSEAKAQYADITLNNAYDVDTAVPAICATAYARSPAMPFFHIEGWYENEHGISAQGLRAQAYWAILGGACGHVFGNDPIWNFAYDGATTDWQNQLGNAGSVGMGHFGAFFRARAWHTLAPDSARAVLTAGYGTQGNATFAACAAAADGSLAVIYMPSNRTMTVDMSVFRGSVTCRWYDPSNGTYTADAASPVAASGTHQFSRATANSAGAADWVLVMEA